MDNADASEEVDVADDNDDDDEDELQHDHRMREKQPLQPKSRTAVDPKMKQKKFAQQRSILKNSQERSQTNEDLELLEAKKQLILRRRRLFSHYRQYEQWRRRQFSYDPCYYRATPLPIGQAACNVEYGSSHGGAHRRRRQYRRQFSCAERSREDSRESRESSSLYKYHSMVASDGVTTTATDSSTLNQTATNNNQSERISFDSSECGALAYQPLHCNSRHFHMLQEEHSASISERCTRSRINSAIFVSSEGRGFDSIEFLRRHGSQSVLCRKARSAENITDNGRKKSFSDKRQWRTDEGPDGTTADGDANEAAIELQECRPSGETRTLSVLQSNNEQLVTAVPLLATSVLSHAAAVTTANLVVGSISIEAPPGYMKDDNNDILVAANVELHRSMASTNSASHDSTDTVEELILVPNEAKSRVLVHQRSSTASSTNRSQSPALSSTHSSPKVAPLSLKSGGIRPKLNTALPMVSVSGPSPPHEKPPPAECL